MGTELIYTVSPRGRWTFALHGVVMAVLSVSLMPAALAASACDSQVAVGLECEITLDALHPTQPAIGLLQVQQRLANIKTEAEIRKFAGGRAVPVVQGPDGNFYLTDGHHQASILSRLGVVKVKAKVIGRFDNLATFWPEMQARHWVYLYDKHGQPIMPAALPQRVIDMDDDPYRALAGFAEYAGYFSKTDAYYMEFQWARYFGDQLHWRQIDGDNLPAVMQAAASLACQPAAKDLPGYPGACPAGR